VDANKRHALPAKWDIVFKFLGNDEEILWMLILIMFIRGV